MRALLPAFHLLSPAGPRARLSILAFHRVLPEPDPLFPEIPDAGRFNRILQWLGAWFNVLPLDEAALRLAAGELPERAAAITFDDGYADNFTIALPLLQANGLRATFFVATGFLDGGRMWNDTIIEAVRRAPLDAIDLAELELPHLPLRTLVERRAAAEACIAKLKYLPLAERAKAAERVAAIAGANLPVDLMLSSQDVRGLHRAGMQVGAHTVSHPILTRLSADASRREMTQSKTVLEGLLGAPVTSFAYPNGRLGDDYAAEHATMARDAGFALAVSTNPGAASAASDPMQLPRFTPWDRHSLRFGARLLANLVRARRE